MADTDEKKAEEKKPEDKKEEKPKAFDKLWSQSILSRSMVKS